MPLLTWLKLPLSTKVYSLNSHLRTFLQIADIIIFDHRIQVCLCLPLLQMLLVV